MKFLRGSVAFRRLASRFFLDTRIGGFALKLLRHRYEFVLSLPSRASRKEIAIDCTVDQWQELRSFVLRALDRKRNLGEKLNFLNLGSSSGSLDGQLFVEASITDKNPISKDFFFGNSRYFTLDCFDLDLSGWQSGDVDAIYSSSSKDYVVPSKDFLLGYPPGFHEGHINFDLSSPQRDLGINNCYKGFFDFVLSATVLEHVKNPFEAAKTIDWLLAPSGIAVVTVPFSYPYHEDPEDYWRITHAGLKLLFSRANVQGDYEVLRCGYDITLRRDGRTGDSVPADSFGGWRENWISLIALRKK